MRRLLLAALVTTACSSNASQPPDGAPMTVPPDGAISDGPILPTDTDRLDAPPSLQHLEWTTFVAVDASSVTTKLDVQLDGTLIFDDGTLPVPNMATAAEMQELGRFLNRAGVFDELRATTPCGGPNADYVETLVVGLSGGEVRKEITNCHQPVYEQLRQLLRGLIGHFRAPTGECAAPNVWRYMRPGCGAEAQPVCGSPVGDGCAAPRCSCTGHDIIGCDFTTEPYAYVGYCRDGGP